MDLSNLCWRYERFIFLKTVSCEDNFVHSGYVYDAVWLYALALDKLIKQNQSYIQDIHSERSVNKFVEIIRSIDFTGVSGRINFHHGNSRLSNIKVSSFFNTWNCFLSKGLDSFKKMQMNKSFTTFLAKSLFL